MKQDLIFKDLNCSGFFGALYDNYSFFPMNILQEGRNHLIMFIHYNTFYGEGL